MAASMVERKMLYCPKCNDTYQEGTQRFCTNDGSRLVPSASSAKPSSNTGGVFTSILGKTSSGKVNDETTSPKPRLSKPENTNQPPVFHTTFSSKVFKDESLTVKKDNPPIQTTKPVVRLIKPNEIASGTAEIGDRKLNPTGRAALTWDNPQILLGQTVKGRYYVTKQLSQDDSSIAYLAEDKIIANKEAIVRVLMDEKKDEFLSRIFSEERVSLSHINHPNIASVLDSGELLEGLPFIVTEAVDGFSLEEKLKKLEQFNPMRTARIIRQVSYALSEVHQNGILHRSLKPSNIYLTVSEAGIELVKVIDFVVSNGAKKQNLEAVKYLAPEQLEGKMPNYASDIYSLAIIAYKMLTGRTPFEFSNTNQLLKAQKEGLGSSAPSKLRKEISSGVDEVFEKALAYNSADRYPKARDFGDALFNALSLAPDEQKIEVAGVGLKEEQKTSGLPNPVWIPAQKEIKPVEDSKQLKIEALADETEETKIAETNPVSGEMSWERRSPEPINTGSSMWLLFLGAGILALAFLAYLSWNYWQNRQPQSDYVANNPEKTAQQTETPVTEINAPTTPTSEIESAPLPRQISQPPDTEYFENSKMNLKGDLAKNYRKFTVFYPKTWTKNPTSTNFLDISKKDESDNLIEQMIITHYPSTGLFSKDKAEFPKLVEKSNKDLKESLGDNFKVISQGEKNIQNGRWNVYEVTFQSSGIKDGKTITIWGRRFWLPTQDPRTQNGFVITMLATSLAGEIASVDDIGNKGDLASILESFEPSTLD